jgi:NAD(P)-dependent dehydrogenase (short-subunit alcohol dehydrogenase family)
MTDPTFPLEKKVAIVVGAVNGIGRATRRMVRPHKDMDEA